MFSHSSAKIIRNKTSTLTWNCTLLPFLVSILQYRNIAHSLYHLHAFVCDFFFIMITTIFYRKHERDYTLSFGWKLWLATCLVKSSMQAILILSGVAGLSSGNQSWYPSSALAATTASLMANNTADARKNGGSPTAFEEWIALGFWTPCKEKKVGSKPWKYECGQV